VPGAGGEGRRIAMLTSDQKITPNLWFDDQAEEAARSCVSVFADSEIGLISRHGAGAPMADHYWERLSAGGDAKTQMSGWLKDKYGVSSQIVPDGPDAASTAAAGPEVGG
jgi:predicted 3-demethylubiquinone-9 3-methyltransferase (glyoxalase superfamily)